MAKIGQRAAKEYGIGTDYEIMKNGERRFRLRSLVDGSSYIRTEASASGAWQNSHFHESVHELFVVQTGWMALAQMQHGKVHIRIYWPGEYTITTPKVPHNVYLPAGAIIHTLKYGKIDTIDWHDCPELDACTRHLPEKEILSHDSSVSEYTLPCHDR